MPDQDATLLKQEVHDYWDAQACGTQVTARPKFSREYFDEIEEFRYRTEPEIFAFAQFTRAAGLRVLEVGVGAGTDFVQWVRAGAHATGVDLTEEAIEHVRRRLGVYGLEAEELRVADCESLPFPNESFDLVYSWGVIHHTPDTARALRQIVRVTRPGGRCKVMVYHRRSVMALITWFHHALLAGRPWRSLTWALHHHMESVGTRGFTRREVKDMLRDQPVTSVRIKPVLTSHDLIGGGSTWRRRAGSALAWLLGFDRVGWFLTVELQKRA